MTVDSVIDTSTVDVESRLALWREQGADRIDPVRFHLIDAMARKSAGQGGATRRVLNARLRDLIAAYEKMLAQAGTVAAPPAPASRPLVDLLNYIQKQTAESDAHRTLRKVALQRATYPELPEIDYFRDALSKVSTNRQVRQSLERVPENAGPLNSNHLVHRSLLMMRELSPGYLRHFLAYVDGLSWMEQVNAFGMPMAKETARPGAARKTSRAKAK
ncbi:hypothetical protein GCM10007242_45830 [Pigmentiphaga litoralis]|uniref:DUF2894 domain-containing protein n=1 Tax=Pigmentiphaga litoralis TaxID=516702 RepID=UPI00167B6D02|nr:DUF2894 domain-containing protein [Pigmentiphaga litoralis]GGX33471.1 hypothetical protein GCM10007242_45830 [Pigmentiphaga litoralis]